MWILTRFAWVLHLHHVSDMLYDLMYLVSVEALGLKQLQLLVRGEQGNSFVKRRDIWKLADDESDLVGYSCVSFALESE